MFNGDHDLAIFDLVELFEPEELKLISALVLNIELFEHHRVVELVAQSCSLRITIFAKRLSRHHNVLFRGLHSDSEGLLVHIRVVVVIEESTPLVSVVSLEVRPLLLVVCFVNDTAVLLLCHPLLFIVIIYELNLF
jgi:hypothetical protein